MVKQVYINSNPVSVDGQRYLVSVSTTQPTIEQAKYNRGGYDGVSFTSPFYRNDAFSIKVLVFNPDPNVVQAATDSLFGLLRLDPNKDKQQYVNLDFVLADNSVRSCRAYFKGQTAENKPNSNGKREILLQFESDSFYLKSNERTISIVDVQMGGMAVPMGVPMSMAHEAQIGIESIYNFGNTFAYPILTLTGPTDDAFSIVNATTREVMTYTEVLTASQTVTIDSYQHTVLLNGAVNKYDKLTGNMWVIDAGVNRIAIGGGEVLPAATVTFYDAWLGV